MWCGILVPPSQLIFLTLLGYSLGHSACLKAHTVLQVFVVGMQASRI